MMQIDDALSRRLSSYQQRALIVGIVALVICIGGAFINRAQFFQSYLFAFVFWAQLSIGCLALLLIQHVAGGTWGAVIRRPLEAGAMTLPLMAVLFIPIIFGIQDLYVWANPEEVAHSELLTHKAPYLNIPFFIGRTVLYFVIWAGLAYFLNKWSSLQDKDANAVPESRFSSLSGAGLPLLALALTFASFDWMMSLEPEWFSTIYGFLFGVSSAAVAFAFVVAVLNILARYQPLSNVVTIQHFNDLGNFLLATVMLWAYMSFSQYLIIWAGNLPEETIWYVARTQGGWQVVALFLIVFHFVAPFFVLLARGVKRRPQLLTLVAGLILFVRLVDLFWLIIPAFYPTGFYLTWLNVVMPIALGGLWIAFFVRQLRQKSLVAINDPKLQGIETHGQHEATSHA